MAFFNSAVDVLQTLVVALGAGLGIWGVINLMEGYGNAFHTILHGLVNQPTDTCLTIQKRVYFE